VSLIRQHHPLRHPYLLGSAISGALVAGVAAAFISVIGVVSGGDLAERTPTIAAAPPRTMTIAPPPQRPASTNGSSTASAGSPSTAFGTGSPTAPSVPFAVAVPTTTATTPAPTLTASRVSSVGRAAAHPGQTPAAPRRVSGSPGRGELAKRSGGGSGAPTGGGETSTSQTVAKVSSDTSSGATSAIQSHEAAPSSSPAPASSPAPSTPSGPAKSTGGTPPGLAKTGGTPPGLAKKPGGVPPGLAKKPGGLPPGQAKKQH
jgi:hypothetical protein